METKFKIDFYRYRLFSDEYLQKYTTLLTNILSDAYTLAYSTGQNPYKNKNVFLIQH